MALLSALLRLADILDESCHRAIREKARTLKLDIESQVHWWRHHYTESVAFDKGQQIVTVWFDFPKDRIDEYKQIIPQLQMPLIESEFRRHEKELIKNGLYWHVQHKVKSEPYSNKDEMPENVETAMLTQLANQRRNEDEKQRLLILGLFKEARPSIERRLKILKERESEMSPCDYLLELSQISFDLFDLGGRKSARAALESYYSKNCQHLPSGDKIRIGIKLLEWFVDDSMPFQAGTLIDELEPEIQGLPKDNDQKWKYTLLKIQSLNSACEISEAQKTILNAMQWASKEQKSVLNAELAEIKLLYGNIDQDGNAWKICFN